MSDDFYRIKRLPPYIIAEVNGMRAAARAEEAGVVTKICVEHDMPHVFVLANRVTPEARRAMDEAAAFLRNAGAAPAAVA